MLAQSQETHSGLGEHKVYRGLPETIWPPGNVRRKCKMEIQR